MALHLGINSIFIDLILHFSYLGSFIPYIRGTPKAYRENVEIYVTERIRCERKFYWSSSNQWEIPQLLAQWTRLHGHHIPDIECNCAPLQKYREWWSGTESSYLNSLVYSHLREQVSNIRMVMISCGAGQ